MNQHRLKGIVSIEFAMGFFLFMCIFFVWAQIAYMGYVSGVVDYAIAETTRDTRASIPLSSSSSSSAATYETQFKKFLTTQIGLWGALIDVDKFTVSNFYYDSVSDLSSDCSEQESQSSSDTKNCLSSNNASSETDAPVAIYQVSYQFNPIFNIFNAQAVTLKREVFVVQEYERDQFYN